MGVLPLQIELGRWKDVSLEYRTCRVCDQEVLENEYHHILFCDALKDVRTDFFGELSNIDYGCKLDLLKTVFKTENLKISGRYVEAIFAIKRETLYKSS